MKFVNLFKEETLAIQYDKQCRGLCLCNDLEVSIYLCDNIVSILVPCPHLTVGAKIVALFQCYNNKKVFSNNYEVQISDEFYNEIKQTIGNFNRITSAVLLQSGGVLPQMIYNEIENYVNIFSLDTSINSFIWNPDRNYNIYVKPYKNGFGIYIGDCLRYAVTDENIANKICEYIKKDVHSFVAMRYPRNKKHDAY